MVKKISVGVTSGMIIPMGKGQLIMGYKTLEGSSEFAMGSISLHIIMRIMGQLSTLSILFILKILIFGSLFYIEMHMSLI